MIWSWLRLFNRFGQRLSILEEILEFLDLRHKLRVFSSSEQVIVLQRLKIFDHCLLWIPLELLVLVAHFCEFSHCWLVLRLVVNYIDVLVSLLPRDYLT